MITVSNIECKYEQFREMTNIKLCFLNELKLVKNIVFNSIKVMKIFKVTMPSLKSVEKLRARNKLKIKVFVTKRGFCRQTSLGLTSLL